jgi:ATP-binding cassette subfamily B protein
MEGGRIGERGRHAELLEAGGLYATLWRLQQEDRGRLPGAAQPEDSGSGV